MDKKSTQRQIYSELFPRELSKADKRRLEILEGAIKAYSAVSYEHVSFDDVAIPAKTSRRLVSHYFPDKEALFETTMKLIRGQYQAAVIAAFSQSNDPEVQFSEYVRSAVAWAHEQPVNLRAWILFFMVSSQQERYRKLHENLTNMGADRIVSFIQLQTSAGKREKLNPEDLRFAAKSVQRIITGAIIEICSERVKSEYKQVEQDAVRAAKMIVAGVIK
ncbi:TetR/AcrR family transcriptional regulator [Bdellovibrio sp. KM01]|uniref:TetR/AcrR family transcriptional regulator n=1 Tax=Bdellovibrio sp. KM01 TaxID=2748865 RepID=UPI0015EA7625|nr:TetR/AcrR family transcriptional regulator [Bdellovibrio sp. KM01]QLY24627.1 TetR family transcriptional regulator [Bdellovibrio sp. KM01]